MQAMCWPCNTRTVLVGPECDPHLIGSSVPISRRVIWQARFAVALGDAIRPNGDPAVSRSALVPVRRQQSGRRGRFPHAPRIPLGTAWHDEPSPVSFSLIQVVCGRFGAGGRIRPSVAPWSKHHRRAGERLAIAARSWRLAGRGFMLRPHPSTTSARRHPCARRCLSRRGRDARLADFANGIKGERKRVSLPHQGAGHGFPRSYCAHTKCIRVLKTGNMVRAEGRSAKRNTPHSMWRPAASAAAGSAGRQA
jgi:hypothetical protein